MPVAVMSCNRVVMIIASHTVYILLVDQCAIGSMENAATRACNITGSPAQLLPLHHPRRRTNFDNSVAAKNRGMPVSAHEKKPWQYRHLHGSETTQKKASDQDIMVHNDLLQAEMALQNRRFTASQHN
jgi:hypothetical protein